jgi:hypothetical protein
MTTPVANTTLANSTDYLINRVNELAFAMSNLVVTVNTPAGGNGGITGTFSANAFTFGNSSSNATLSSTTQTFSGINATQIDSWALSQFTGVDYLLSVRDMSTGANNSQITKILAIDNGGSAFTTEYGTITTNSVAGSIGSFNGNTDGTNFYLWFTPSSANTLANTTVKFIRTVL